MEISPETLLALIEIENQVTKNKQSESRSEHINFNAPSFVLLSEEDSEKHSDIQEKTKKVDEAGKEGCVIGMEVDITMDDNIEVGGKSGKGEFGQESVMEETTFKGNEAGEGNEVDEGNEAGEKQPVKVDFLVGGAEKEVEEDIVKEKKHIERKEACEKDKMKLDLVEGGGEKEVKEDTTKEEKKRYS